MKEVKSPKKPLIYYYGIVLLVILIFNMVVAPLLETHQVKEVDYGTFMKMIEEKNIGNVEVDDSEIVFTDKEEQQIYKTGKMDDATLTDRLYAAGATFTRNITGEMSPLLSFFLSVILPIAIFAILGQYMAKKMMSQAGGPNAMTFGMGKSNAKVYVPSSDGTWPERTRPRKTWRKSWTICTIPRNIPMQAHPCPRVCCWWALRVPVKPCWPRRSPVRPGCRFSPCPGLNL